MLSKIVALVISPLGTALLLMLLAVLGGVRRRGGAVLLGGPWRQRAVVLALVWLGLWSLPVASDALAGWVEAQAGPRDMAAVPSAPVIVVLGGGVWAANPPLRPDPDLDDAADRIWHAARPFHAGKAPAVLRSGGSFKPGVQPEAQAMRRLLLDLGVPDAAIVLESSSTDTSGNAQHTAAMLRQRGIGTAILVTSALHMPRARAQFEREGLTITPAPTDFEVAGLPLDLTDFLPSAAALDKAGRAMKELVGWWAVRVGVRP